MVWGLGDSRAKGHQYAQETCGMTILVDVLSKLKLSRNVNGHDLKVVGQGVRYAPAKSFASQAHSAWERNDTVENV